MARGLERFPTLSLHGFTLAEILFVLAIFSVLAAIAIPDWASLLPTHRLNSAARQIQSQLATIKSRAVAKNASYRLSFSTTGYVIQTDPGSGWQSAGESGALPEGIAITSSIPSALGFTARGTATPGTGGTVKLCNGMNAGTNVVVSSTGRIRICKPSTCDGSC